MGKKVCSRQKRYMKYRSILARSPQHSRALQECLASQKPDEYDQLFLHVFAPVLTEYVEWVLASALRDGRKRLYFLARDGWLLYHAAQQIAAERGYDLELRYLRVSRYSIRSAQYYEMGRECLDLICTGGIAVTFERVMKRALLTQKEAHRIAVLAGYENRYENMLNYRQIQQLKRELEQIPEFFQYVKEHAKECRENVVGYLRQEGLLEDVNFALVDSGWIGTLQQSIGAVVHKQIPGYYFGLYELPDSADRTEYQAYYFLPDGGLRRKVCFSNSLFETICSSPEGMTIGYRQTTDVKGTAVYIPLESQKKNPNGKQMQTNLRILQEYVFHYLAADELKTKKSPVQPLLTALMGNPRLFEAETLGSMKFCDDVLEFHLQPVAEPQTKEELKKHHVIQRVLIKANIRKEELQEYAWQEGSICLSGGGIVINLMRERLYKYIIYIRKELKQK